MNDFIESLNSEQYAAVTAQDGPVLVVAGAGSGKTRVLTTRVAWLLSENRAQPSQIIAFTFTNKAAKEMRERVSREVGEANAPFWIGTFHATGLKILRADGQHIGVESGFSIFDTDDSTKLLKQVMKDQNIDPKQFTPNATRSVISNWKNEDVSPEKAKSLANTFIEENYAALYEGYEAALRKNNALDFDDLILRTVQLLEQVDEVRLKYANKFRYVMVDEFQDTNSLQLLLVKLLSSSTGNVFAVGDDDQSIYSWRGARIENMLKFEDFFPGAITYRLEQNYRSTGNILDAANAVIAHNKKRKGKNLWTADGRGDQLTEEEFFDDEDEAARLVDIVRAEVKGGLTRGDITVLYRTNAQSRVLEDALRRASIPYQIVGSLHFYDRKEVRDLMAYLKMVANPSDRIAATRVINVPKRKIGNTTVERLVKLADKNEMTLGQAAAETHLLEQEIAPAACKRVRDFFNMATRWRMLVQENMAISELLKRILKDIKFDAFLEADDPETASSRNENIAELVNAAGSFDESSVGGTLDQFLEQVALVSDPDKISEGEGTIRLMTIHTAKGLEFPVVVLAGVEDDILPHINSRDEEHTLEEERRLFYVAITRARTRVYLLHAARRRRFGTWQDSLPSRFLPEIPDNLVERRHLNIDTTPAVSKSLFGKTKWNQGSGKAGAYGASSRQKKAPPRSIGSTKNSLSKPMMFGTSAKGSVGSRPVGWDEDIVQESAYYEGQFVSHGIFGAGKVLRVEGMGNDLMVTVEFHGAGRKHINPRFAPLTALD